MAPQEIIIEPANPDYYYYPDDISDVPVDFPSLPNGEAANVTWLKNNAPLEEADLRSRRVRIRTHEYWSRLVINSLHVLDSAQYKCRASNSAGSVETSGILRVAPGTSHSAPQSIGGDMGVDDLMLDYENEMTPLDTLQGPSSSGSRPQDWFLTEKRGQFEPGTCVPYAGNACAEHLRGERVLVMSDNPEDMYDIERHLQAAAMFIADHQDLSSQCKHYSNRVACLHKFKVCAPGVTKLHQVTQSDRDKVKGKVRRLCRRDCDRLKSDLCPKEYSLAEEHSLVGDGPQHMLPKCANLDNSPNCFSIDAHAPGAESNVSTPPQTQNVAMSPLDAVQTSHICYVGSGRTYRGATSQTENGYQCLRWAGAAPKRLLDDFPSLHGAANFCRNPDGSKVRPWCYAGPTGNEHYCNVPRCADGMFPNLVEMEGRLPVGGRDWDRDQGGVEPTEPSINKNSSKPGSQLANSQVFQFWNSLPRHYQYAAACGATALILLLLIAFICCCWKSCRRRGKKKLRRQGGAAQDASAKSNGPLLNGTGGGSVVNCQNGPQVHNSYGRPPGHPNGSAHSAVGGSLGGSAFGGPPEMNALLPQQNAQHSANAYYYHQLTGQTTPSLVQLPSTHQPTCQQPLPSTTPQLAADWLNFGQLLGQTDQVALWQGEMHPPANVNGSLLAQLQRDCNNGIDGEGIQVALVSVQEHASPTAQREFQQETQFAAQLRHANVLQLLGICAAMRPMCAVYEFGVHGDLHEFLKLRRPATSQSDPAPGIGHRDSNSGSNVGSTQADKERVSLDHADFLHIAKQIAAGMSYLAARSYVHRDLASRNCMVTDRLSIKITCFSVPRSAYSDDYCLWPLHAESMNPNQQPTRALLPIRWLPPESLLCGQFNEQSDVWSFGVTLWEVFSYGAKPYSNYGNEQVLQLLGQRCLLECPKECPTRMYSVMMECWAESAGRRPSLAELHARLQSWSVLSSPAQSNAMFPTASGAPSAANGISNAQRPSSVTSGQTSSALVPLGRTSRQSMPNPVPVDQSTPLQQHPSNAPGGHFGVGYGSGAGSKQGVGRAQIQGSESPRSGKRNRAPPMSSVHGDLHEFLKLRRPATSQSDPAPGIGHRDSNSGSNVGSTQADKERVSLDHADFLHIAKQIAAGMSYLAARSYVHRDLASRNCMVTDRLSIKITCFSVPRSAYSDDYCLWPIPAESLNPTQHPTRALLPIRWLPPESLLCGQFNEQSDVWSFGVTLWEVFSYGAKPYSDYGNEQVLQLLGQRCLLECPKECPTRMYSVMMECWAESAGRRPSLAELHARLQSWSVLSSPAQSNAMFPTASGAPSAANGISNAQRPSSVTSGQTSSALVPLGRTSRQSMPNPVPVDQSTPLQQHPSNAPGGHFGVGYGSGAGGKQGVGRAQIQGSESPRSGKRNRAPPMSRRPTNYDGDTDSSA